MAPEEIIKELLVNASIGVFQPTAGSTDWAICIGRMVDEPDKMLCIYETGGKPSEPKQAIDYPSIQVRVRSGANDYQGARQKAIDVKNALLGIPSQNVGADNDRLTSVTMISDITSVGTDRVQRPNFTVNFALIFEPTHKGYRQ